jgi:hypothetical protein
LHQLTTLSGSVKAYLAILSKLIYDKYNKQHDDKRRGGFPVGKYILKNSILRI